MSTETAYTFSVVKHISAQALNADTLADTIDMPSSDSGIAAKLIRIDVNPQGNDTDRFDVVFERPLSFDEAYALGHLVAEHDGAPNPNVPTVVTLSGAHTDAEGLPYARPKASGIGYILNDRDVLVCTATMEDPASPGAESKPPYEDLYVENPIPADATWGSRTDWGEIQVIGVYRSNNPADPYGFNSGLMPCTSQAEAAQHAICTIYQYQAALGGQPIAYEIQGGALFVDVMGVGLGDNITDKKAHQIYAVAAPNLPARSRFFDGYLMAWEQNWMVTTSSDAMRVDPNEGVDQGAPFGEASKLWVYIYYPPGKPVVHHILRLKTFRYIGTAH